MAEEDFKLEEPTSRSSGGLLAFLVLAFCLGIGIWWLGSKLWLGNQPWTGIYYPDSNAPGQYKISPEFKDKDTCLQWGYSQSLSNINDPLPAWDCGRGCEVTDWGGLLCGETVYYDWNREP